MKRLLDHLTMLINYLLLCGILKFVSCKIYLKVFFRVPHQTQACFCRAPNVRRSLNCGLTGPCGVRGQSGPVRSDDRLLFHTLRPSAPLHTENSPTPSQINLTDRPSIWKSFHSLPSTLFLSFFLHFFLLTASFIYIYSLFSGSSAVRPRSRQDPRLRSPVVKSTATDARERRQEREREMSADRWAWLLLQTPLLPILSRCASCQSLLRLCVRVLYHKNLISFRVPKGIFLAHKTFISNSYRVTGSLWHSSLPLPN